MSARALNISMGWIVAVWLLAPVFSKTGGYAFYACMAGAVATVIVWAILTRYLERGR